MHLVGTLKDLLQEVELLVSAISLSAQSGSSYEQSEMNEMNNPNTSIPMWKTISRKRKGGPYPAIDLTSFDGDFLRMMINHFLPSPEPPSSKRKKNSLPEMMPRLQRAYCRLCCALLSRAVWVHCIAAKPNRTANRELPPHVNERMDGSASTSVGLESRL
jgi:hypothetical protein